LHKFFLIQPFLTYIIMDLVKKNTKNARLSFSLSKERSARSILSLSNVLFLSNTWTLCRSLWLPALLMGAVCTLESLALRLFTGSAIYFIAYFFALLLLYFFSAFLCGFRKMMKEKLDTETSLLAPLRIKGEFKSIFQGAPPFFYLLCIEFHVCLLLVVAAAWLVGVNYFLILPIAIVALLLTIPFGLAMFHLTASDEQGVKTALNFGLRHAKRYFGSTCIILFIASFVGLFLAVAGSLPTLILQWAIAASDASVAVGDPTDLPNYVQTLSFVFIIFAVAFAALATLFGWIAGYLQYHAILTKEKKRLEQQKN